MKRTTIAVIAVAGLFLIGCASPKVGVNQTAPTGAGSQTTGTTTSPAAATPTTGTVSPFLTGTAHPTIPALVPGKVAIIQTGTASGTVGTTVPVMVGNGTKVRISSIEVAGPAVDASGKVLGSGESQGFEPYNLSPGKVAFGFVYFSSSIPAGATFQFKVTYQDGASSTHVILQVTQANAGTDPNLPTVVGTVTNPGKTTVKNPIEANVYCFDANGAFVDALRGFTDRRECRSPTRGCGELLGQPRRDGMSDISGWILGLYLLT